MVWCGGLVFTVACQPGCGELSIVGLGFCFAGLRALPGEACLAEGGEESGFVLGYQNLRVLLKGGSDVMGEKSSVDCGIAVYLRTKSI